jgi:hypothetical protein
MESVFVISHASDVFLICFPLSYLSRENAYTHIYFHYGIPKLKLHHPDL